MNTLFYESQTACSSFSKTLQENYTNRFTPTPENTPKCSQSLPTRYPIVIKVSDMRKSLNNQKYVRHLLPMLPTGSITHYPHFSPKLKKT